MEIVIHLKNLHYEEFLYYKNFDFYYAIEYPYKNFKEYFKKTFTYEFITNWYYIDSIGAKLFNKYN
jgi:hypothetical protein